MIHPNNLVESKERAEANVIGQESWKGWTEASLEAPSAPLSRAQALKGLNCTLTSTLNGWMLHVSFDNEDSVKALFGTPRDE